jgi:hypothetical protein
MGDGMTQLSEISAKQPGTITNKVWTAAILTGPAKCARNGAASTARGT